MAFERRLFHFWEIRISREYLVLLNQTSQSPSLRKRFYSQQALARFSIPSKSPLMRKSFIIVICFFTHSVLYAQSAETDSLKNLLANTKEDTSRVLLLEDLSFAY